MTALADNLFKYYSNPQADTDTNGNEPKDTQIEVISEEEAKKPPSPPTSPPPPKRGPLLTGKRIILAVIVFLIAVDIPIGLRLLRQYQDNRTPAVTTSPSPSPPQPLPPSPTTALSPFPTIIPTAPITPPPLLTPIVTPDLTPTEEATETSSIGTTELAETAIQTHAECFNGACIEVEGAGVDQCIVDDDCLQPSPTTIPTEVPGPVDESPANTPIPVPDTPAAGSITNTILGILGGVGILSLALLL